MNPLFEVSVNVRGPVAIMGNIRIRGPGFIPGL
jgi:hypothetical protein